MCNAIINQLYKKHLPNLETMTSYSFKIKQPMNQIIVNIFKKLCLNNE